MNARCLLAMLLCGLSACSEKNETEPTSGSGGAGGSTVSTGGQGGGPSYADAVRAANWVKLESAPSVGGGAKQDDIFMLDRDRGFVASGPNQSIYATTDGGASWSPIFMNDGTYFRAVLFTNDQRGFAGNIGAGLSPSISDPNVIYATENGGADWAPVTSISGPAPEGICNFTALDDMTLFAVGRANGPAHLLTSSDGGTTWTSVDLGQWLTMAIDVHFRTPTEGIVAGMGTSSRCTIARTTDGGATFEQVFESQTPGSLCWKLSFPSTDIGYVAVQDTAGGPGTFGKTTDGGATWQELPLPINESYGSIGVGFVTDDIGWMASEDATLPVYRTFDGGMTWEVEPVLVAPINRFRFVDANTAYAVGANVWKLEVDY
ncbi:MAG TPA: hypothetical protein VFB62_01150 [Polyangiaceae bacterium]|nr:hypothetical protein [Polyangiaceae bacterium]